MVSDGALADRIRVGTLFQFDKIGPKRREEAKAFEWRGRKAPGDHLRRTPKIGVCSEECQ
jgi:hypothetical protein